MEKFCIQELKTAAAAISEKFNIKYNAACQIIGYYNATTSPGYDPEKVRDIIGGAYESIPVAARVLKINISENQPKTAPGNKTKEEKKRKSGGKDQRQNNIKEGAEAYDLDGEIVEAEAVGVSEYDLPANMSEMIEGWINDFATRYKIDLARLSSQQWRSCCDYIGEQIKKKQILIDKDKYRGGAVFTYKPERLEGLLYLWAFFSGIYKQVPIKEDFIAFAGVHRNYFYDYDKRGLTSVRVQIVKKAEEIEERGLMAAAVGGGSNAVGGFFGLKTRHGYTETSTVQHVSISAQAPTVEALPVLGSSVGILEESAGEI